MYSNVAVGLLIIAVCTDVVLLCPNNCSCSITSGINVDCDNQGLTVIPRNFPNDSTAILLSFNPITTIEEGAFQNMTLLRVVIIEFSALLTIDTGAFRTLPNLTHLRLDNNQITLIQPGAFKDLPRLAWIFLSNNRITTIQKGTFVDLPDLYTLYVTANQIQTIEDGAFQNLSALYTRLYLHTNQIATLQKGLFQGLSGLEELYLSGNLLTIVNNASFENLTSLRFLRLNDNRVTTIQQGSFQDLSWLFQLWLANNQITTIEQGTFDKLTVLYYLDLGGNNLTLIKNSTFKYNINLNTLILSNNRITSIQQGSFQGLSALRVLSLWNNQITTIQQGTFDELPLLYSLNLGENNLTFIKNDTFEHNINLNILNLDLVCDCNVPFWSWLKSESLRVDIVTCLDHHNVPLSSLNASNFDNCTYNSCHPDYCSNGGSCNRDSYGDLVCLCVGGWTGEKCTDRSCHPDYCSNGGSCSQTSNGDLVCSCVGGWTGATCTDAANICGENVDNFNTTWSLTAKNALVVVRCTGEYTGNASRYCSSDGKWDEPSYIHCISKSIQQLKEQTAKLLSGESDYNLTIIMKDLENITNDNDELRSGDLLTSSAVLNDIAKYVTDHKEKLEVDQLEIFGSLCDNLLDERNHQQWKELNDEGSGGVTPLVNAVTEYNDAFNEVIDSNYSLVVAKENVVMQVGKASVDEITVPDRLKTSNSWIAESATEIKLKKNICSGLTGYSSTFYRNISSFFPEYLILNGEIKPFNGSYDVNSIVADFTIHGTACSNYSLIIKFEHLLGKYTRPFCGHWNFSIPNTVNGAWSSYGSQVIDDTDSYTICEYNHTTNFAILMSPGKTPSSHHDPLSLISAIGCGVSILFLVITILIHFVLWRYLGNDRTKTLMNLCVALILSYILFLAGITRTENKVVCTAIAVALHYMFLTDFALMLAEGIQIVRMVVIVFPTKSIVHKLIPACWIVPACIVGISAGVTKLKGYGNEQFCWLTLESYLIWAFIGPALLVILINFIIIIITVYKMMTSRGLAAKTLKVKSKIGLKSICVILPLFGVTWVLGAFSVNDDLVIFQYLFAIFNSLQGLFICVFHCFLNKQVRQGYRQYQKRRHANRMDSKQSTDFSNLDRPKLRNSINDNIRAQKK